MPKSILKMPFKTSTGLDLDIYTLAYDTGEKVDVLDNSGKTINVNVIAGGFTMIENAPNTGSNVNLSIYIDTSPANITSMKSNGKFAWIKDVV